MRTFAIRAGLAMIAGVVAGGCGGRAVTAGMSHPPVLVVDAAPARSAPAQPDAACAGCSDYDLGYRFAATHRSGAVTDCSVSSWSYRRGCLAFLNDG